MAALAARYPYRRIRHAGEAGGLAVLSKLPISHGDYIKPTDGAWFPAWRIIVETSFGPLQVINVHLRPNIGDSGGIASGLFKTPAIRRREIERLLQSVAGDLPIVFVGDFNENADGSAMSVLADRGMTSALVAVGSEAHTWRWRIGVGELKQQIDHIVVDRRLEVVSAEVLYGGASDHFPVVATFQPAGRAGFGDLAFERKPFPARASTIAE